MIASIKISVTITLNGKKKKTTQPQQPLSH